MACMQAFYVKALWSVHKKEIIEKSVETQRVQGSLPGAHPNRESIVLYQKIGNLLYHVRKS
jgi:hypothetical protein